MSPSTIGAVGAGQAGNGIAHVAAAAGFCVVLGDVEVRFLERARGGFCDYPAPPARP